MSANSELIQVWAFNLYNMINKEKAKHKKPDGSYMTLKEREVKKAQIIKMIEREGVELRNILNSQEWSA